MAQTHHILPVSSHRCLSDRLRLWLACHHKRLPHLGKLLFRRRAL